MRLSILLALVLATGLVATSSASAASVCLDAGVATFAAADVGSECPGGTNGASEVNVLTVSANATGDVVFSDANQAITDADGPGGCSVSAGTATCPGALGFRFDLGGGGDSATVGAVANGGLMSTAGAGDDHLVGGPLGDILDGGAGDDVIQGGDGNDTLSGGDGSDTVDGGNGNDVIDGGAQNDTLTGGPGADTLTGGTGDDSESGGDDNDSLDGGSAAGCVGSAGNDVLRGDAGDDALCGGAGPAGSSDNDSLNGGDGEDTAYYVRGANVSVSLDNIAGDGQSGESDNVHSDVEDVTSGSGADTLVGSDGRNVLDGGPGPDTLSGLGGNDVLIDTGSDAAADHMDGGAGDDLMAAGRGPDTYVGGDGEDGVTDYAARSFAVSVTLDGNADDGAPGEGDNVEPDVEDVTGSAAGDTLIGNASDNELDGGAGDDTISGAGGNDGIDGGAGRDTIDGGAGRDDLVGGAGADTLKTRDGQTDRANCGGGTDSVQGEARDDIAGNCENVDLAPPTAISILSVQVTRAGFVVVKLACPAVESVCGGTMTVKTVRRIAKRFIQLGRLNYRLRGGQTHVYRPKIAKGDRRPLKRARRVKVRTIVTNANGDTGQSTAATKLTTVTTRGL
jgi:Ca2+-binding RTX toxin-like protein